MYQPPHMRGRAAIQRTNSTGEFSTAASMPSTAGTAAGDVALLPPSTSKSASFPIQPVTPAPLPSRRDWSLPVPGQPARQTARHGSVPTLYPPGNPRARGSPLTAALASPSSDLRPTQRRFSPAPSEMELLASVSRSGGDGADGDALKDYGTQERFRTYIEGKIGEYHHHPDGDGAMLKNIVRLFRKLREGVLASGRLDMFAIDVVETSVRYAVLAKDAGQLYTALSTLVPDLYLAVDAAKAERAARGETERCAKRLERMQQLRRDERERTHSLSLLSRSNSTASSAPSTPGLVPGTPSTVLSGALPDSPSALSDIPSSPLASLHFDNVVGLDAPDNRAHFVSLLLIYHLVHSPRELFASTLAKLAVPQRPLLRPRPLQCEDCTLPPCKQSQLIRAPPPFVSLENLDFARRAARALAPETFDPIAFSHLVTGDEEVPCCALASAHAHALNHPDRPHDHPAALERALLAWAAPAARTAATERLRRAYMAAPVGWVAQVLNLDDAGSGAGKKGAGGLGGGGGSGAVALWALANGMGVKEGVVKLR